MTRTVHTFQQGAPPIREKGLYVFDFDGVLSSGFEHAITLLPPEEGEAARLREAVGHFDLRCEHMAVGYQRHLVYQAAAYQLGLRITPGPALDFARQVQAAKAPWFLLTARSGWYASTRLMQFLDAHRLRPTEMFQIGRVPKDRQFGILLKEHPSHAVFYMEDTPGHIEMVQASEFADAVTCYRVMPGDEPDTNGPEEELEPGAVRQDIRQAFEQTLAEAIALRAG